MRQYVIYLLAVIGGGTISYKLICALLDRYKDSILDYAADTLMDYIMDAAENPEKSPKEKIKKKLLLSYLRKGADIK